VEALTQKSHKLAEELYKQQAPADPGPQAGPGNGNGAGPDAAPPPGAAGQDAGDVVDAEYTVKD